jgi:hypothetical protein
MENRVCRQRKRTFDKHTMQQSVDGSIFLPFAAGLELIKPKS